MVTALNKKIIVSLLFLYLSTSSIANAYTEITDTDRKKAINGEIIIKNAKTNDGLKGLQAIFSVNASKKDIWETLIDYENFQEIFSDIERMRLVDHDEKGATVEFWANAVIKKIHYVLYRSYNIPGHKLSWRNISGDIESIEGSWTILDTDDSKLKILVYDSYVKVGMLLVPEWVVRLGAMSKAKSMAENLRNWIEQHKDSSR